MKTRSPRILAVALLAALGSDVDAQKVLWKVQGTSWQDFLGLSMAVVGDIDGDGASDVAASRQNEVVVFSGRDGRVLKRLVTPPPEAALNVAAAGDLDRDGVPDILAVRNVSPVPPQDRGLLVVYSGRTGTEILSYFADEAYEIGRASCRERV